MGAASWVGGRLGRRVRRQGSAAGKVGAQAQGVQPAASADVRQQPCLLCDPGSSHAQPNSRKSSAALLQPRHAARCTGRPPATRTHQRCGGAPGRGRACEPPRRAPARNSPCDLQARMERFAPFKACCGVRSGRAGGQAGREQCSNKRSSGWGSSSPPTSCLPTPSARPASQHPPTRKVVLRPLLVVLLHDPVTRHLLTSMQWGGNGRVGKPACLHRSPRQHADVPTPNPRLRLPLAFRRSAPTPGSPAGHIAASAQATGLLMVRSPAHLCNHAGSGDAEAAAIALDQRAAALGVQTLGQKGGSKGAGEARSERASQEAAAGALV